MRRVFLIIVRKNFFQLFAIVLLFALLGRSLSLRYRIYLPMASVRGNCDAHIVIEVGHAGAGYGINGISDYLDEALVSDISRRLEIQLVKAGFGVDLTRTGDANSVETNAKDFDIRAVQNAQERAKLADSPNPNVVLLLHAGYSDNPVYSGAQVLYRINDICGKSLAELIQMQFMKHLGQDNRRAKPMDNFVFKNIESTVVLVEVGFLSNSKEEKLLQSSRYRERLAYAIRCGVEQYLSEYKSIDF
jgi:N-acetylmuramoyl-L-alanine amidase